MTAEAKKIMSVDSTGDGIREGNRGIEEQTATDSQNEEGAAAEWQRQAQAHPAAEVGQEQSGQDAPEVPPTEDITSDNVPTNGEDDNQGEPAAPYHIQRRQRCRRATIAEGKHEAFTLVSQGWRPTRIYVNRGKNLQEMHLVHPNNKGRVMFTMGRNLDEQTRQLLITAYNRLHRDNPLDRDGNLADPDAVAAGAEDGQGRQQQPQGGVKVVKPGPKGPRRAIANTDDPNDPTYPMLSSPADQRPAIQDFIKYAQNQQRILLNVGQACVLTVLQDAKINPSEFDTQVLAFQNNPEAFEAHCIKYLGNLLLAAKDKDALARTTDQLRVVVMAEGNAVVKLLNFYKQQAEEYYV